jgi:hypothetical protein
MNAGTTNSRRLLRLFRRDGAKCFWCGHPILTHRQLRIRAERGASTRGIRMATVDHVLPRSQGGSSHLYNLVASCAECNVERSRPGNAIDEKIQKGEYVLPQRPPSHSPLFRPSSARSSPVLPVLDQDRYVQAIPWRMDKDPTEEGLYLVTMPGRWRVLLVPVVRQGGHAYVLQGEQSRVWESQWWWCPLDDLLDDSDEER